ncbi:MAG TPA: hypothetical protein EYO51_08565 [Methylococcaceae bacterium]|jgi:LPS-assembly lipoprotein|nr:hypothetical protein [Methylococcaceae bacterium]HIN67921.1 hypothetical protein [Methylococcales bacterium]HIA45375.1 hypothetical protein [Methylococcaceae bacterium]HIB63165.1 hypothetical protein [Methylococcaceae bacterium]HIO13356.1 hypothetical protein [Methylococcales bacterium]
MYKIFTVALLAILLTACGYKIRGQLVLPVGIEAIHLVGASPELRTAFEKSFRFSSATLVRQPTDASITVKILDDRFERRTASLSERGKSTEFEVISFLRYEVYNTKGQLIMSQQQLTESRVYFNDQTQIVAKQNEEKLIREEIYTAIISRLIDQVLLRLKKVKLQTGYLTPTDLPTRSAVTPDAGPIRTSKTESLENKAELIVNKVREQVESISQTVQQLKINERIESTDQDGNVDLGTQ